MPQQTGARQAAQGIADPTEHLTETARFTGACGGDAGQAFGEDSSATRAVATAKAPGLEAELNLAPLPGQIAELAIVPTVVRHAVAGAGGTARRLRATHTNHDHLFLLIDIIHEQLARHGY
jgi:hypothetical protein